MGMLSIKPTSLSTWIKNALRLRHRSLTLGVCESNERLSRTRPPLNLPRKEKIGKSEEKKNKKEKKRKRERTQLFFFFVSATC